MHLSTNNRFQLLTGESVLVRAGQTAGNFQPVALAYTDIAILATRRRAFLRHERLRARFRFFRIRHQVHLIPRCRPFPAYFQQQRLILRRSDHHLRDSPPCQPHRFRLAAHPARLRRIHRRPCRVIRLQRCRSRTTHQRQRHAARRLRQGHRRLQEAVKADEFPPPLNPRMRNQHATAPGRKNRVRKRNRVRAFRAWLHLGKIHAGDERLRARGDYSFGARVRRAQASLHARLNVKRRRIGGNHQFIPPWRQTIPFRHPNLPGSAIHAADRGPAHHAPAMQGAIVPPQPLAQIILAQVEVCCRQLLPLNVSRPEQAAAIICHHRLLIQRSTSCPLAAF